MVDAKIFYTETLTEAAAYLQTGGVLAYPSESVWGLGCDAFDAAALERVIALKSRDVGKGLIVLTDSADRLGPLLDVSHETFLDIDQLQQYSLNFTQEHARALTWLVPVKSGVLPKVLTGAHTSLAVRITTHPLLAKLCAEMVSAHNPYGLLVSTSCNLSGQAPATTLDTAMAAFGDRVAYLNAEGLGFDQPSCIMDLVTGKVLR